MTAPFVVMNGKGTGSVAVEAALALIGAPYRVQHGAERNVDPMEQVPALILPSGELMTESAAILIRLADEYPEAGLAPRMGDVVRRVNADARLTALWAERFPFQKGWER